MGLQGKYDDIVATPLMIIIVHSEDPKSYSIFVYRYYKRKGEFLFSVVQLRSKRWLDHIDRFY